MKVFKSLVLLLLLFALESNSILSAQNRVISGKVLDVQQEPLAGVTIQVNNTSKGSISAADGSFNIQIPSEAVILNFSYVGYLPQKVKVTPNQKNITVYLQEDAVLLDEAVVVGYGTQKE